MKRPRPTPRDFAALRQEAEANLRERGEGFPTPPATDAARLIHELQVAQIELQMQNDELRRAQREIEASRDRYADLYDFAPVGYLTLDLHGQIWARRARCCSDPDSTSSSSSRIDPNFTSFAGSSSRPAAGKAAS
jgi:hypothetical protein